MQADTLNANVTVLRIITFVLFVLSLAVTLWAVLLSRGAEGHGQTAFRHTLHIIHVVMIVLTFLSIAVYLHESAQIASLTVYRELFLRMTVDPSAQFVTKLPSGAPVFNVCVGALAKMGIIVKSADSMKTLALASSFAVLGNSDSREGYEITRQTLRVMGVKLTFDIDSSPVKLVLGEHDGADFDFVLTQDKIAHVLAAVFVSRLFVKFAMFVRIAAFVFALAAIALLVLGRYTYAAAAFALLAAFELLCVYRIEKRTARFTFDSIAACKPPRKLKPSNL